MIVLFDTVRRKRPVREGGELIQVDWNTKKILGKRPLYPTQPDITSDPNPRGNSRGGKGILIRGNQSWVGTYHTIYIFDRNLNVIKKLTHPLFVNIHEMCFAGQNIWVSATSIDCAVLIDQKGKTLDTWWPREDSLLQKKFGLSPLSIDKSADNRTRFVHMQMSQNPGHTHLNSVVGWEGHVYALLNRLGAFVRFKPDTKIVLRDHALRGAHSPRMIDNGQILAVCSSFHKEIRFYRLASGKLIHTINLMHFPQIQRLQENNPDEPFNKAIFVRGLDILDSQRILAGITPASILEIDISRNQLVDYFQYSMEVGDAVHGLGHYECE